MWRNVVGGLIVVAAVICLGLMIGNTCASRASAEEPSVTGKGDVEVKDLGSGVYRVDVKTSASSRDDYEKTLVEFCEQHSDSLVSVSPAPVNQKGNTGVTTFYWVVSER